jgi:hypothetical protein
VAEDERRLAAVTVANEKQRNCMTTFAVTTVTKRSFKECFLRWVIDTFQPYSVGQRASFRDMINSCSSKEIIPVSRNQIPMEISRIYFRVKEKVRTQNTFQNIF